MKSKCLIILFLFSSCRTVDQDNLSGRDARIFKDTPLWDAAKAIRDNEPLKLKQLLAGENKATLDFREKYFGQTMLNWAVYRDDYEAAKILIEQGANPNIKSNDSTSAMIHAADKKETNYLELLLNHGGNPNTVADTDEPQHLRTPLMAASFKSLKNVQLLIKAGANPNYVHRSKRGDIGGENIQSALIYAFSGNQIDIVKYLVVDVGVEFNYVFSTTIDGKPHTILTYLRDMPFPIESDEHKIKMVVVEFLKSKGLDYSKEPIPQRYYKQYDKKFLENY